MNDATPQRPPVAARKPSSVTHHGITVADDYAWLRDPGYPEVNDKEVLEHLAAENAWFEARISLNSASTVSLCGTMRASNQAFSAARCSSTSLSLTSG